MAFPPDEAKLVSIFIQTLLYGAYAVLFVMTCWVLVRKRVPGKPVHKTMMGISITMFVLATMHIGVNYTRIIKAFITFRNDPGGPATFFNQLSEFTQIFGSTIYVAQTLVGDSVALWRCYVVWSRRLPIVAFPLLLLMGSTATGVGILYSFARVVPEAEIFVVQLSQWIVAFFSMTLATNIICTSLVAFRIWSINRECMTISNHNLRPVMLLVIESGSIYSATLIALLVLYKTGSWFQYVLLDAVSPIVGLVFSMIIIRIGLGFTSEETAEFTTVDTRFSTYDGGAGTRNITSRTERIELGSFRTAPKSAMSTATSHASSQTANDLKYDDHGEF